MKALLHRSWFRFAAIALLLGCVTGCESERNDTLTGHLWDNYANPHRGPAKYAALRLYHTTDSRDVLVRYLENPNDEKFGRDRSFLLLKNTKQLAANKKPTFLFESTANKLQGRVIPTAASITNLSPSEELQGVVSANGHQFSLVMKGKVTGSYALPTYAGNRIVLAMGLPATVLGDTAYFGAPIILYGLEIYAAVACHH